MLRSPRRAAAALPLLALALLPACEEPSAVGQHGGPAPGTYTPPPVVAERGMSLAWADEFNGTSLDRSTWYPCYHYNNSDGCTNEWNRELQYYMPEQLSVRDGRLRITAEREPYRTPTRTYPYLGGDQRTFPYRSGMAASIPGRPDNLPGQEGFDFTYGYVEFAADYPVGRGLWPALWMLPTDRTWPPEIDILEIIGQEPDTAYLNVHAAHGNRPGWTTPPGLQHGTHTFGVHWTPDRIDWYVDHRLVHSVTDRSLIPQEPMYLLANIAVGGVWPKDPDASTPFPAEFSIDYVRVWQ